MAYKGIVNPPEISQEGLLLSWKALGDLVQVRNVDLERFLDADPPLPAHDILQSDEGRLMRPKDNLGFNLIQEHRKRAYIGHLDASSLLDRAAGTIVPQDHTLV